MRQLALLSWLLCALAACKGDTPPPAVPAALAPGGASGPAGPSGPLPRPRAAERAAELARLLAEVPAESTGGETPEATARAFTLAVAGGDRAAFKALLLSRKDMRALLLPETVAKAEQGIAKVLYKVGRSLNRQVEVLRFVPGESRVLKAGEGGFRGDVTSLLRSTLEVKVDGREAKLRFRSLIQVGKRWKISAL